MKQDVKNGLIVFARKPVLGKVKTRLAATIGEIRALEIYKKLLIHTKAVAKEASCESFAFLTEIDKDDFWEEFSCQIQSGETLGDRMQEAFSLLFDKGFHHCIIIGSDCPSLKKEIINNAFDKLKINDIVIGAAEDGGYYLLGMKNLHSLLFKNKKWSTESVFKQTLIDINQLGLTYHTMPILNDLDEEKDIPAEWL